MNYYKKILQAVWLVLVGMASLTFAAQDNSENNATPRKRQAPQSYYESPVTPPPAQRRMASSAQKDPNFSFKRVLFREGNQEPAQQLLSAGTVDRWPSVWDQTGNDDTYIKRLTALALSDGTTLLHIAMRKNHVHCITDLLRYGEADLTAKMVKSLSTPLHEWAMDLHQCSPGQAEMVASAVKDMLVRAHATFPDKSLLGNDMGSTPLHVVCSMHKRNPNIFKALIAAGHPIDVVNHRGQTILHYLAHNDRDLFHALPTILSELRNYSVRSIVNRQDHVKRTALHAAVYERNRTTFDFLVSQPDINLNLQDNNLETPLHAAARLVKHRPDDRVARFFYDRLIALGADQKLLNEDHETPADILTHD